MRYSFIFTGDFFMRHLHRPIFLLFFIAATTLAAFSQAALPPAKVAIIDTEALSDPKAGITKLVNAINKVNLNYKSKNDELAGMQKQIQTLMADVNGGKLTPEAGRDKQAQAEGI